MSGTVVASGLLSVMFSALAVQDPSSRGVAGAGLAQTASQHWSFQPVQKAKVPEVRDRAWLQNPIDAFVLEKLEAAGWRPAPPAEPAALLRRIHLDLTGIPPTIDEQDAFARDPSDENFAKLIDELLARPSYGERWARHWLDLVRYAETNGYERDAIKPHVWRYRDYVIRAFNADKPFDRFVLEQIAGDELPDADSETRIATGLHRLGHWDDEPADPMEDRFDQLDDIVSTTAQAFLGLSLGCARCHDHKFEPLSMLDYYRMVAVFAPLERPRSGRTELDMPAGTAAELARQADRDRQIELLRQQGRSIRDRVREEFLRSGTARLPADVLVAAWTDPARRRAAQKQLLEQFAKQMDQQVEAALDDVSKALMAAIERQIEELRRRQPELPRGYWMHEPHGRAPATHLLIRGKASRPGAEVMPGVPAVLVAAQPKFLPPDEQTTRRRLSLARWIASPDHPLTARVIVNRVWQFHFGEGLVRTPSELGLSGERPTHPELLDWLAHWFIHDAHWSIKELHRLIMSSSTYRMSKRWDSSYAERDPENRLLWRQNYRRLEVEAIRDSMLAASGQLNRQMYGPSMYPQVPREALQGHSDPDKIWKPFDEADASRRTVYAFIKRSMVVPMLEVLDLCDSTRSSARRQVTTVAPQALSLFNGDFANRQARHLADRLVLQLGDDIDQQIEHAYRAALCRSPSDSERDAMRRFMQRENDEGNDGGAGSARGAAGHDALVQACRVILNLNEFVYTD